MKNLYIELIKRISTDKITFLSDVNKHINTDKRGKFKYFYIPYFDEKGVVDFISKLDHNSVYTIIPLISIYGKNEDPHIILSKQILISNYSNPPIVSDFLFKQLEIANNDFAFNFEDNFHYLIFKYKKIIIDI